MLAKCCHFHAYVHTHTLWIAKCSWACSAMVLHCGNLALSYSQCKHHFWLASFITWSDVLKYKVLIDDLIHQCYCTASCVLATYSVEPVVLDRSNVPTMQFESTHTQLCVITHPTLVTWIFIVQGPFVTSPVYAQILVLPGWLLGC